MLVGNSSLANAYYGTGDLALVVNTGSGADVAYAGGNNTAAGNLDLTSGWGTDRTAYAGAHGAGSAGNFDLSAAFGDALGAEATGANFLVAIEPALRL